MFRAANLKKQVQPIGKVLIQELTTVVVSLPFQVAIVSSMVHFSIVDILAIGGVQKSTMQTMLGLGT
jgi:hypothetical protein